MNIEMLITEINKAVSDVDILIVDDDSKDGTISKILELQKTHPNLHLKKREKKLGIGSAYLLGFGFALEKSYRQVIQMDADLSHDPRELKTIMKHLESFDFVVGSRYLDGVRIVNWPLKRLILSRAAAFYTQAVTGMEITDPTSGFNGIRTDFLKTLDLSNFISSGYVFQIELKYRGWKSHLKMIEHPITFTDRVNGKSKMDAENIWQAFWNVLRIKFK